MVINIQDDILKLSSLGLLGKILQDKTTRKTISSRHGVAQAEYEREQKEAETEAEVKQAEEKFKIVMDDAMKAFNEAVQESVKKTIEKKPQELVEQM